jgi:NADPH:quinone reductase
MKQYLLGTKDGHPALELREVPQPTPGSGQLLVRNKAASLNRGELIVGHGLMHAKGESAAKPFGLDAAGEIIALGSGVTGWSVGQKVMGRAHHGFAEYSLASAKEALPVPDAWSWEEAGAAPIVFLTAYDMLVANGHLAAGEWVLVTGISSGVGVACLQMAKALGAKVIGTSGSQKKLDQLKPLGLDHGLVVRGSLPLDEIKKLTGGHGVDIVINNVGGTMFAPAIAALAYRGRLATVGYVDGSTEARIDLGALHSNRLQLFGVSNKNRTAAEREASSANFIRDISPLFAQGKIRPLIDKVYPFADLQAAQARMLANDAVGKIVVTM